MTRERTVIREPMGLGNLDRALGRSVTEPVAGRPRRAVAPLAAIFVAILASTSPAATAGKPYQFDAAGYLGDASLMPDWAATMSRQASQSELLDACLADAASCPRYYRGLRYVLLRAEGLPPKKQVSLISRYVNKQRYRGDRTTQLPSSLDDEPVRYRSRWSTVEEFMRRGGDCEDYATTKYYLLRRLGFSAEQLRIVVTWDHGERGYHAVLAVQIPDNDETKVWLLESDDTIKRGSRHRYRFIYSINEESIWDHEASHASVSRNQPASLTKETST